MNVLKYATLLSLAGSFSVSSGYSLYANIIWCVANIPFIINNHKIKQIEQRNLFIAFELIAIYGIIREVLL
jgi:hypothetical protein